MKPNRLFETVLIVMIFSIALVCDPRTGSSFVLPKLLALRVGTLCLLAAWLIGGNKSKRISMPILITTGLFATWLIITTFTAFNFHTAVFGDYNGYHGLATWLNYLLIMLLVMIVPIRTERILRAFIVAMTFVAGYAVLQKCGLYIPNFPSTRPYSTIGNAVPMAAAVALAIPLCIYFVKKESLLWYIPIIILFAGVFASQSIGPLVGLLTALVFVDFCVNKKRGRVFVRGAVIILALSLAVVFNYGRMQALVSESIGIRIVYTKVAIKAMRDNPVFGVGPGNLKNAYPLYRGADAFSVSGYNDKFPRSAHNGYVDMAAKTGAGLLFYLMVVGAVVWKNIKKPKLIIQGNYLKYSNFVMQRSYQSLLSVCFLASIMAYMVQDITGWAHLGLTPFFFIILGLGGSR